MPEEVIVSGKAAYMGGHVIAWDEDDMELGVVEDMLRDGRNEYLVSESAPPGCLDLRVRI